MDLSLYSRQRVHNFAGSRSGTALLCGGHPSILAQAPLINDSPLFKCVMNNTALVIKPDLWIGMDEPGVYQPGVLQTPAQLKIGRLNYFTSRVHGHDWRDYQNQWFMGDAGHEFDPATGKRNDWLRQGPAPWFKNTFAAALFVLYRLGFSRVILAGCAFTDAGRYATGDNAALREKNTRLYGQIAAWLHAGAGYFAQCGLTLLQATPGHQTSLPQVEIERECYANAA